MSVKKKKSVVSRKGSFFKDAIDRFSIFVYSLFTNGRAGTWLSEDDGFYDNSQSLKKLASASHSFKEKGSQYTEMVVEQSKAMRAVGGFRKFLSYLNLNVYGVFFLTYGLSSVFMYYITILLNGKSTHGLSSLVTALFVTLCALPMLTASESAVTLMSESRIMRRLIISFLGIPKEKLRPGKHIGGSEYMFMAAIIALLGGVFTYFLHSAYLIVVFGVIILLCLISSNPETGVVLSIAATPFLQYTDAAEIILVALIAVTSVSYLLKLLRHRRTISFSPESMMSLIFCGFVIVASVFSAGGTKTLVDSLFSVIIIFGGFYITYNLMRGENRIAACTRILSISFLILCISGVWNVFYDAVFDGVMYSMKEYIQPILEGKNLYIADSASEFGVLAVLVTPLIFTYATRQKNARGMAAVIGLMTITVVATFIYGTYETIIAVAIEFCLFWMMYSHKTLKAVIFSIVPISIFMLLYSALSVTFGWGSVVEVINDFMPLGFSEASTHNSVVKDSFEMLFDGHLSGIGAGEYAFKTVFSAYSDVVSSGAENPGAFVLQIICWSGLGGLVAFLIFIGILLKKSLGYLIVSRDKSLRRETLALLCGLSMAIIFGSVNCIWSNIRMLYLFWVFAGLLAGCVKEGKQREAKRLAEFEDNSDCAEIELRFYK